MSGNIPYHYTASTKRKIITLDFIYKQEDKTALFSIEVDSFVMLSECTEVCKKHNALIDELQDELYDEKTGQCLGCNAIEKLTWCGNDYTNGSLSYSINDSKPDSIKNQILNFMLEDCKYSRFIKQNKLLIEKLRGV